MRSDKELEKDQMKEKAKRRYIEVQMHQLEDDILYFD
mgnify:CR=1 FL=1